MLLEKDTATVCFCHHCVKLHRWHTRWDSHISLGVKKNFPRRQYLVPDFPIPPPTRDFTYHYTRLVMNRYFYGPNHGITLHKIEDLIR